MRMVRCQGILDASVHPVYTPETIVGWVKDTGCKTGGHHQAENLCMYELDGLTAPQTGRDRNIS